MKMQGPNAPWCIGSAFFPPQLLTKDLGPLVFNPLGDPQRLLSTGQRLQQFETGISTSEQTESFIQGSASSFVPRALLQDHLLINSSSRPNSQFYGNLLQGLKCSDGSVVVFFVCGEGTDRIAGTVCRYGSSGKWSSTQTSLSSHCLGDSEQNGLSVSPSLQHSIRQLSAVWTDVLEKGSTRLAIVAARTSYHVFFCIVSVEEDRLQFLTTAASTFQVATSHVAWSPHDYERAAVILESGTLCIFEIKVSQISTLNGAAELIPTATLKWSMQRCFTKLSSQSTSENGNQDQEHGHDDQVFGNNPQGVEGDITEKRVDLDRNWWCCEFGWFPHTLLVANSQEIYLLDLVKQNCHNSRLDSLKPTEVDTNASTSGIDLLVNGGACGYSRFCSAETRKEIIVAFGRDPNGGMFEFSVATERHVILFDTRQPQTPILQWEHGMRQDPPSLLIMCPLSALRSLSDDDNDKGSQNRTILPLSLHLLIAAETLKLIWPAHNLFDGEKVILGPDLWTGKIILAASYQSGDIRVFCYGSEVCRAESPVGHSPKKQKLEGHDLGTAVYAWDMPSRLYAPLADVDDLRDVLSSSEGLYSEYSHRFVPKSRKGGQNVAGIVLLSENSAEPIWNRGQKNFTILQLTGQGELLAQVYKASRELQDLNKARIISIDDNSDAEDPVGLQRPEHHEVKFAVLPTFLRYIHTGSVLNSLVNSSGKEQVDVAASQGGRNRGATSERTKQDLPVLSPNLEKTVTKTEMETQLKVLIRDLNVPLNMHEVARKVLGMGLPERLSHSDSGVPSDLNAHWHRGFKFPSVSSLLGSTVHIPKLGESREGEAAYDTLSSGLTRKTSFKETIPFPLLLEIQSIEKRNAAAPANVGKCWRNPLQSGHLVVDKNLSDISCYSGRRDPVYSDLTFAGGHNVLTEGREYVEGLIDQLVSKQVHTVISLSEPTENWQAYPESDGQSDSQILLYSKRRKEVVPSNISRVALDPEESLMVAEKAIDKIDTGKGKSTDGVVLHDLKENCGTHVEDFYSKLVAGKSSSENQESCMPKKYLKIDPTLCPIKLCFTDPDEELEPGELAALEDMQASFFQWQQCFPPYRNL